jgi:hypothetical protein
MSGSCPGLVLPAEPDARLCEMSGSCPGLVLPAEPDVRLSVMRGTCPGLVPRDAYSGRHGKHADP